MPKTDKPNILIIWGDDIGWFNVSMNNNGILQTFKEFPPRQTPASFSIDQALERARKSQEAMATGGGVGVK